MSSTAIFRVFIILLLVGLRTVRSGWLEGLRDGGLDLGDSGIKVFLDRDKQSSGRSLLDQYSLRMGYSSLGMSLAKNDDTLDVGIYYNDKEDAKSEGRGKKMGQLIIPLIMGYKASAIGSLMMAAVGGLVMKSLMVAKLALMTSSILGLYKLFGSKSHGTKDIRGGGHVQTSYHSQPSQISSVGYEQIQPDYYNHIAPTGYASYPASLHASASDQAPQYAVFNAGALVNTTNQLVNLSPQHLALRRRHANARYSHRNKK